MNKPMNTFIQNFINWKKLGIESFDENREWGGYYILASGPNYDVKILWIRPRQMLSLQSHGNTESPGHHEVWMPLTNMRVIRGITIDNLEIIDRTPGGVMTIAGGHLHTLINPFTEDNVYVYEVRISLITETSEERENRIIRIYDKYARGGTPLFPPNLLNSFLDKPFDPKSNCAK